MIKAYMLQSIGILLTISPYSQIYAPECANCSCCKEGICETRIAHGRTTEGYCTHGCNPGFGGIKCLNTCPDDCLTCELNNQRNCETCADGNFLFYYSYDNKRCEDCPPNCKQCTSKTKCQECNQPYYNAKTISNCSLSSCPGNCICESIGICSSCKQGYFNVSNTCLDACPNTCTNCTDKSHCQSCKPTYSGDMCCVKDGYCKKCSSSTVCKRCDYGYYGETCNKSCLETCQKTSQETQCEKENGTCLNCGVGLYGNYCKLNCSESCLNNLCHKDTGNCIDGCVDGYQGQNCTEENQDKTTVTIVTKTGEVIGIASAVFVVYTILFIIVNIVIMRRWKRNFIQKHRETVNSVSYVNTQTTAAGTELFQYEQLDEVNDRRCEVYEVINSDIK